MPELLLAAAAALAGWSWLTAARAGKPFKERHALALAAAGGSAAAGRLAMLLPGVAGPLLADLLLLAGSVLALVGVSGVVRTVTKAARWDAVLAEAALVATSTAALAWVLVGVPPDPGPGALLTISPALVDLTTVALVARLAIAVPGLVTRSPWKIGAAAGAAGLICLSNSTRGLEALGIALPAGVATGLALGGYGASFAASRFRRLRRLRLAPPPWLRVVPYLFVASAAAAVLVQALAGGTGPVQVVLVVIVVAGLVVLQALGLRENARLLEEVRESRHRLEALFENTSDLIVRLDVNGRVLGANAAAVRLLHRTPVSMSGRSFDDLAHPDDRRRVREAVLSVTRGLQESAQVELRLAPPAAGSAQLRLRAASGGAVANLNDATDAVELRQRLERMARYDQMTGLLNRAHLLEIVGGWLAEPDLPVAVLYADLDGFKAVNDRFGHGAGDRVLTDVAARLEAIANGLSPRRTIVARVGGDEFVLGLEGVDRAEARAAAERVVDAVAPPFTIFGRTVQLGVSVGVAGSGEPFGDTLPLGETGAAELVHRADLAMYEAKAAGRARVGDWEPALEERAKRRVDIAIGLRGALDTGRLGVAYQPIVRLSDGVVAGVEALLRLPAGVDAGGRLPGLDALVSPAELVAVAEDTGTITEMGQWVLARAARQAADWAAAGHDITVNVNISVQQLLAPDFVDSVNAVLEDADLPASRLVLELTESQLAGQASPAVAAMEKLRAAGIRFAIDDFGTGYSSLSYLRHLPVQEVKIDRTLLEGLGTDPRAEVLVRAVVSMARDLGLLVVAEGLEDLDTVAVLRRLGADAGQGFALSPALPAFQLTKILLAPRLDVATPAHGIPALRAVGASPRGSRRGGSRGSGGGGGRDDGRDGDLTSRDAAWAD